MNLEAGIWKLRASGSWNLGTAAPIALSLWMALLPAPVVIAQQAVAYDVILRGGTVLDGTGRPRYRADVGTRNGRVVRIGDLAGERAAVDVDVAGLFVTPGFINLHSHASPQALPAAVNMLTQGVTLEMMNADGGGPTDIPAQLERLGRDGLAVNVGVYIGFNGVWRAIVGPDDRRATDEEIEKMRALVTAGLEAGAWGVSAGLDYKPAYFATTDEVVRVVEAARRWRTHFTNHERVTPESGYRSRVGVEETITIGERAGLSPLVTHIKAQGPDRGDARALTDLMRAATTRGAFTSADVYPYLAGQTSLGALIIPAWAQDGGNDAMRRRFADPALRAKIAAEAEAAIDARFSGAQGVYLPVARRQLVDVMEEWGVSHGEAVIRLLEENGNQPAILTFGDESDLVTLLQYRDAAIACDCGATTSATTHPRNYGTYPRVLGRYVRETNTLTWEDAVRKMTGLPAGLAGLVDRGFLAPGMAADITVFDPATVIDRATYEDPAQYSVGVRHVLVNGRFALRDGAPTGERAGAVLRRGFHMPSRSMSVIDHRGFSVDGTLAVGTGGGPAAAAPIELSMRLAGTASDGPARAAFRLVDRGAGIELELVESGLAQAAPGWATWSGIVRVVPTGALRAVTVILDRFERPESGPGTTVIVSMDDGYRVSGIVR